MIEEYEKYYNPKTYYVIEGNLLDAELALELHRKSDVDVVFVGMPKNNPNILFERIRLNALKYSCWTNKYSDSELLIRCQEIIEQSKKEEKIAKKNKLIYLDTSFSLDCLSEYVENIKSK